MLWLERLLSPGDAARGRIGFALQGPPPPGAPVADYHPLPAPPEWLKAVDELMVNADAALPLM